MAADGSEQVAALGMAGGSIIVTGTLQNVRQAMQLRQPLDGRTLLPGFIEAHMHVLPSALYKSWLSLTPFQPAPRQQELNLEYSFQSISQLILAALAEPKKLPKDKKAILGYWASASIPR
ncbi:hypothetical protein ACQ4WP_15970 [Janthinobacterium sp. GB4P2]|uniref:hypothetical protein n=1 Tax=Janthinobacterium sp. GB4P2 TaxID=3424189 RepID=UPI003F229033